jgi:hypothetical protein
VARIQSKIIRVRLTPQLHGIIEAYAINNGIENKRGDPNLSGAARTILEMAVSDKSQESLYRIAYANARADLLQSVSNRYGRLIEELSKL